MKYFSFLITLFIFICELTAQPVALDSVTNNRILIGAVTRANIADSLWYRKNYNEELVSAKQIKTINKFSVEATVEVYFGTWCSDSRYWVPAFIGMLDKTKMADRIQLIALSRSKESEETAKLKEIIERVPTFVFWRNGNEIGRIVETPEVSLAKDMIKILKK